MLRIASAALAVAFSVGSAHAQAQCLPTVIAHEMLAKDHGERAVFRAPHEGAVIELWADDQDGSWTLFVSRPDGMSCLVAAGSGMDYSPIGMRL